MSSKTPKRGPRSRKPIRSLREPNEFTLTRQGEPQEQVNTIGSSALDVWIPGSLAFYASDFNNIGEFSSVFDQYRINWVQVDFLFAGVSMPLVDAYFASMPYRLLTAVDHDDVVVPLPTQAGWNTLLERHGARVDIVTTRETSKYSVRLKPKVLTELYRSSTTTAYAPTPAPFIDSEKTDVPHYGLKYVVHVPKQGVGVAGFPCRFDVVTTYNITFKGLH